MKLLLMLYDLAEVRISRWRPPQPDTPIFQLVDTIENKYNNGYLNIFSDKLINETSKKVICPN